MSQARLARLPQFLIIGAAKAGTTTSYRDLATQPHIFFPVHKEPHNLVSDLVLTDRGSREYARMFTAAGENQVCGEASTGYTKSPRFHNVAQRARQLLGANLKLIYIVREPVARAISQHGHFYHEGRMHRDFNVSVRGDGQLERELIGIGKYAMQLAPWIEVFGLDQICVVHFERYVRNRATTVSKLCDFLGVRCDPEKVDADIKFNVTSQRRYGRGLLGNAMRRAIRSKPYRLRLRAFIPDSVSHVGKRLLFRSPRPAPIAPSRITLEWMLSPLNDESRMLATMIGLTEPLWDSAEVCSRFLSDPRCSELAKREIHST